MPYTNCSACGAKALVGATRCPRCQVPFVSYDIGGERVPTVNCPNCGVQRPVAIGVCPNCLTSTAPAGARLTRALVLVGLGIAAIVAVGYAISRWVDQKPVAPVAVNAADSTRTDSTDRQDSTTVVATDSVKIGTPVNAPTTTPVAAATSPAETSKPSVALATVAAPVAKAAVPVPKPTTAVTKPALPVDPAMIPPRPALPPKVAVSDSGSWEYAVAITWVRVRSAPTRDSDVLRMVDSAQKVRLGPPQNGWRPVRVGVDRGWVDPRLFSVIPASRP